MDEQGLEFLQFAFCWFNCLLIREDTHLAEGDALPEFLMFIFVSFLILIERDGYVPPPSYTELYSPSAGNGAFESVHVVHYV
ncbi:TBC1 domain-containing protein [Cinnamomum micranthum f. kanehirae]|uniref:TBC1 domain-containing protein n=1 Tax=Cinnamomum micranthum f. kanehirae TaxID=337451 RepID=A0A3S3N6G7_9MAGN|nr:TBC1 domain-containing protein [Cinnamomum micranthum f. kanehirae]